MTDNKDDYTTLVERERELAAQLKAAKEAVKAKKQESAAPVAKAGDTLVIAGPIAAISVFERTARRWETDGRVSTFPR